MKICEKILQQRICYFEVTLFCLFPCWQLSSAEASSGKINYDLNIECLTSGPMSTAVIITV